jgi:hypothetical protein
MDFAPPSSFASSASLSSSVFSLSSEGSEVPRNRSSRGFFLVSVLGGGEDGGVDSGCASSLFGLDAAVDDGGIGLKKLKIDPFLAGLLVAVVDSAAFLASSGTIFGKDCASVSISLSARVSVGVISGEMRRFFRLVSRGESSRVLRLPYVRIGLARGRDVKVAGLSDLFQSVPFLLLPRAIERTSSAVCASTRSHALFAS